MLLTFLCHGMQSKCSCKYRRHLTFVKSSQGCKTFQVHVPWCIYISHEAWRYLTFFPLPAMNVWRLLQYFWRNVISNIYIFFFLCNKALTKPKNFPQMPYKHWNFYLEPLIRLLDIPSHNQFLPTLLNRTIMKKHFLNTKRNSPSTMREFVLVVCMYVWVSDGGCLCYGPLAALRDELTDEDRNEGTGVGFQMRREKWLVWGRKG